jgi:hypothetical protein
MGTCTPVDVTIWLQHLSGSILHREIQTPSHSPSDLLIRRLIPLADEAMSDQKVNQDHRGWRSKLSME